MLTNINRIDRTSLEHVILGFNVFCSRCDHLIRRGLMVYKIDGASFMHLTCPDIPTRAMSTSRRIDPHGRTTPNGDIISYDRNAGVTFNG